jgi:YD repeat-containing protein
VRAGPETIGSAPLCLATNAFFYAYDPDSRLTNRWSAAKTNTVYGYDPAGNLTNISYPVSHGIMLAYDATRVQDKFVRKCGFAHFLT